MYKIGLLSDIHGNDVALQKLLTYFAQIKVDEIICLGDLIAIGPSGNEVLKIVTKLPHFSCIRGNHEKYYLTGFNNPGSCTEAAHQEWVKAHIDSEYAGYLKSLPFMIERNIEGVHCVFLHYAFHQDRFEFIVHNPQASDLDQLFADFPADVICYGHEHVGGIIQGQKLYINPGSCGCPHPAADVTRGIVLNFEQGNISFEQVSLTYDPSAVIQAMDTGDMPDRDMIKNNFYHYKKIS